MLFSGRLQYKVFSYLHPIVKSSLVQRIEKHFESGVAGLVSHLSLVSFKIEH